jgi:hypothetical protein
MSICVMEPNSVLAPVLGAQDQFELLGKEGMVRMDYPETSTRNVAQRRN